MVLRKIIRVIGLFIGVGVFAFSLTEAAEQERPKFYFSFDYFLPGNIEHSLEEAQIDITGIVNSNGGNPLPSKDSSGAFGGRFGLLVPLRGFNGYWIGGNIGYVVGPSAKLTVNDPITPPGTITREHENSYVRALLEIAHISELNKKLFFKFDVGVGLGKGKTKQTEKYSGYYTQLFDDFEKSHSSTKLTWEISPALIFKRKTFDIEVGARYVQFPEIKESNETYKVDTSGFGFYTGIGF